ncbi:hypothetical protein AB7W30_20970 [Providencia manganoxydans]|uniref:hypothetical protein n=1 Tax=Providencia manganoxydans TaxID=2923283 RepID=UPI0032DB001E
MLILRRCFSKEWRFFTFLFLSLVSLTGLAALNQWLWQDITASDIPSWTQKACFVAMFVVPTLMFILALLDVILTLMKVITSLSRWWIKKR